jgi:hypothetical protein
VTAGLSVLSFVLPSPPEGIAKQHGVGTVASPTEEQAASLDKAWKAHANKAREQRIRGGIASIVIAGAAIGFGTAMATGSFDFSSDSERTVVSALLIGGGAAAAIGAVGSLVLPSAAERSFAAYRAAAGAQVAATERPFRVAVSGAPAGLGLGLDGSF